MTDHPATHCAGQSEDKPKKGSAPLTREQILQKLAEAASQKKSARLAAESARNKKEQTDANDGVMKETVKVVRTWLAK